MLTLEEIKSTFRLVTQNKMLLNQSNYAACYSCKRIFKSKDVTTFLNEGVGTAVCPYCGIDSVLGDKTGLGLSVENIQQLHDYWFGARV